MGIADDANSEGDLAVSHKMMADKTRFSPATVKRFLAAMEKDGYLKVIHKGGAYRGDYNRYLLVWPEGVESGYSEYYGVQLRGSEMDTESIKGVTGELQSNTSTNTNTNNHVSVAGSPKKLMSTSAILAAQKAKKNQPAQPVKAKAKTPPTPETLMAQQLLRDRWDSEKEATGKDPLWSFPGVLLIIKGYIKGGHTQTDIEYLLDNTPVYTKNAFQLCLSQRGKTPGGRAQVEQAMSALDQLGETKKSQALPESREIGDIIDVTEMSQGELT